MSYSAEIQKIVVENERRKARLAVEYDPVKGLGCCGERVWSAPYNAMVPREADVEARGVTDPDELRRIRCRHDFEFWAATCVTVRHKLTGADCRFVLNAPQRRVVAMLEHDRLGGRPLRLIMLKARQWGGSTLVQMYFAWIQTVHRRNWNSLICAHVKDTAATIRGMYSKMLDDYPPELWEGDDEGAKPAFKPFERSVNSRVITGRGCKVTLASAENQEAVRGLDVSMAHLSEVAFWPDTPQRSAPDFVRAICSGIPLEPYTFVALESTANGVGNFFHREWLRAERGESDLRPVFVPWYEIEIYRMPVDDPEVLWQSLDDYERALWNAGNVTLEMLNWYHNKRRSFTDHAGMKAEYPSNPVEAFAATGAGVFNLEHVERLRRGCCPPEAAGEVVAADGKEPDGRHSLRGVKFVVDTRGELKVWHRPWKVTVEGPRPRYVVTVDVGGRSAKSDFSVIAVMEVPREGRPRIAAQWRGHIDHDRLAWKAAAIATWYCKALLVVESNTLETEWDGDSTFILEELRRGYSNVYHRAIRDRRTMATELRAGFHTNRSTKSLAITAMVAAVRDGSYEERDSIACDEMSTYELTPSGGYEARAGCHDDVLMTRAIGLYVVATLPPPPDPRIAALTATPDW